MRATRSKTTKAFEHALTNGVTVEKGQTAYFDTSTSLLTEGGTSTTLKCIGVYDRACEGDGVKKARVRLFKEIRLNYFVNDTGTPVVASDMLTPAYAVGANAVTSASAGASQVGIIWGVNSVNGVAVQVDGF